MARAKDGSRECSWSGSIRRLSYCGLDENKVREMVLGRVCMADGSIAFVCTGFVSMVSAVAAAVHTVDINAAYRCLDIEHYVYLLCLASADSWTAVDRP